MANEKVLSVKLKVNTRDAEQAITRITKKINSIDKALNKTKANNLTKQLSKAGTQANKLRTKIGKVNSALSKTSTTANKITTAIGKAVGKTNTVRARVQAWKTSQRGVLSATSSTNSVLGSISSKLRGIASTYLGIMGTKALIGVSDTITSAQNKLNYTTAQSLGADGTNADGSYSNATFAATQEAMDKMYVSSQKVRMNYTDMMSNVSKSMALAGDAFGNNTDNAIRFQEVMAEAYAVGGASAEEMSSSMYQLIQALGAGTLAGDELRSVREGAPLAYKAIEEFVQGVYDCDDSLKDMAADGMVSSDMVVAAMLNAEGAAKELDAAFAQTEQTFAQTWTQIKSMATKAFEPVSNMLRDALNRAIDNGAMQKLESFFFNLSKAIQIAFKAIEAGINWIVDNWDWLKQVIIGALIAIIAYYIIMGVIAVKQAIASIVAFIAEHWVLVMIVAAIALIIYFLYLWYNTTMSTTDLIVACLMVIVAVLLIVGLVTMSIPLLIAAAVVLLVALIFNYFEQVCGGAMWLGAVILDIIIGVVNFIIMIINLVLGIVLMSLATVYNSFVGFVNALIQSFYSIFVEPIAGIIEWFVNAFSGGFDSILGAAANAIGQMVSMLLSGLKVITKAIDAVAGTELTAKVTGWQDSAKSWGKNENAVTYSVEAPTLSRVDATDAFSTGANAIGYIDYVNPMDAYDTGAKWGAGVTDKIDNWGSQFQKGGDSDVGASIKDKLGIGDGGISGMLNGLGDKLGLDFGNGLPDVNDPANGVGGSYKMPSNDDLINGVGGIGDDVGKIADSMDLTEEDLEYLRKIAAMEWKKEYTTANVVVDMSNYNTINNEADLDGIVTKLADKLYEEMDYMANGVYA